MRTIKPIRLTGEKKTLSRLHDEYTRYCGFHAEIRDDELIVFPLPPKAKAKKRQPEEEWE